MNRSKLRENIFKLLYTAEFQEKEEMPQQMSLYFTYSDDNDEDEEVTVSEKDQTYMEEKYHHVTEHIPEIDEMLNRTSEGWKTTIDLLSFIQLFPKDPVFRYINHIPGTTDNPLDQQLILPSKAAEIPRFIMIVFHQQQNIPVGKCRFHTGSRNLKNRKKQRRKKNCSSRNNYKRINRAPQNRPIPILILQPASFPADFLHRRNFYFFHPSQFHVFPPVYASRLCSSVASSWCCRI